jgi:mannose-6-phosphate isomerase-like protein (cupin superfamily)
MNNSAFGYREKPDMALSADVRRVVTTVDANDKAVVLIDDANPHKKVRPNAQTVSRVCWVTDQTPADLSGTKDRAAVEIGIMPPKGGSVFRIVDFPPETAEMRKLDPSTMQHSLGDGVPKRGLPPRHPAMHRTRTVDYAIVMQGEIDMLLDDSEIHLKAGDVLVQQGTNHAWVNRGTEPCRIAFVLIDSKEP